MSWTNSAAATSRLRQSQQSQSGQFVNPGDYWTRYNSYEQSLPDWMRAQEGEYIDDDLRRARALGEHQRRHWAMTTGIDPSKNQIGQGYPELQAALARYQQRRGLKESIDKMPGELDQELGLLRKEADASLGEGLSSTRKNFNRRGLLYSGLRQGGEQQVRNQVASGLSTSMASARQDAERLKTAREQAFASVGLAHQAQQLQLAEQALEQSMRNRIARTQAMQQLGGGVGAVSGLLMARSGSELGSPGGYSAAYSMPQQPMLMQSEYR